MQVPDVHSVDDPGLLLELINNDGIDIVATVDQNRVATIPCNVWNDDIEKLFSLQTLKSIGKNNEKNKVSRAIKSHCLLTHSSIIDMKIKTHKKKQEQIQKENKKM